MGRTLGLVLVFAVIFGLALASVSAMPWFMGRGIFSPQNDTAINNALQNKDYNGYINALQQRWQAFIAGITPEKFQQLSSNYVNMTAKRQQMQAENQAVIQAIKDNNFQEWQAAVSNLPRKPAYYSQINAGNFPTYVQYYNAIQNKDFTTAQSLAGQLNITMPMRGFKGGGFGFGRMRGMMGGIDRD